MRKCSVEGCEKDSHTKGFCKRHYDKNRRFGTPYKGMSEDVLDRGKKCSVEGCLNKHYAHGYCWKHSERFRKYGDGSIRIRESHLMWNTPEYRSWCSMKTRCYNPNFHAFDRYGGRDIIVCDRWKNSFNNFFEDMGEKPFVGAELDRINNDGNYEPLNCRWVNHLVNSRNKG